MKLFGDYYVLIVGLMGIAVTLIFDSVDIFIVVAFIAIILSDASDKVKDKEKKK